VDPYLLARCREGRRGSFFFKSKGPKQSGAYGHRRKCWSGALGRNRMGILVAASHLLIVIHGLSFAFFAAGGGSMQISIRIYVTKKLIRNTTE